MERHYNIGKLRQVVKESTNEFEPVYGKNVPEDNKKINNSAYDDINKETKAYDGGLVNKKKGETVTTATNKGMSDIAYDSVSKPFADKVKAQVKGFTSADAEKNHKNDEFGNADFWTDKEYDRIKNHAKDIKDEQDEVRKPVHGGEANGASEKTIGESKKIKQLTFKKTQFLGEEHMLSVVPDDYKKNGNKFVMKDGSGNAYLVEWADKKPNVKKMLNEQKTANELNRIKELFGYRSKDYFTNTTAKSRLNEINNFSDMIAKARDLV